ncbi:phenylalanine--tRNA ligase subunit beta [Mycoplasmopsis columboralis]|uniref:phenylalanine--tRNA ligase n=1 Tax=Mycoplasmopsis columboralis TaxID=171282 RepID=A0A449B646_9BACT|nr:phenylalanine--tRNA ligase subunit beta [Mycoplasmopsis columboralis]VEU76077.1 Phenylalanine--tRNA ligase beta subunit [Mycoplasmopsis columboralis]
MILSLNHLNKYLPKKKLTIEVEKDLNALGFEVEYIKPFSDAKGLRFAEVLDVQPNPNTDKLDVVKLKLSDKEITIQTNNKILKPGDLTVCFVEGSSKGEHVFAPIKLQGVISEGMFASWSEMGYDWTLLSEKDQVLVLDKDFASLSDNADEKFGLTDYLIEISTTANRNDANSYYTIASELAAYYQTEVKIEHNPVVESFTSNLKVNKQEAKELMFLEVEGKKKTSLDECLLLAKHQIDSKFNWAINLTNLCLLETGAPAHVYPKEKITSTLSAQLYSGKTTILGNKEVEVENVLAIKHNDEVVSLACVMGIEEFKVTEQSDNFVFEIGVFDPKLVRHGAKEIKILSNSANQGSRVISKEIALRGMQYLQSKAHNLRYSNIVGADFELTKQQIPFDEEKLKLYSGMSDLNVFEVPKQQLKTLGFEFDNDVVKVPNYRYDVTIFADIIEELFRFYSYDNFAPAKFKNAPIKTQQRNIFKNLLASKGYDETRTFTLVSEQKAQFNPFNFNCSVKLLTFVSKEREVIRNSLAISLQEVIQYNQKRKLTNLNIFEKGMINDNVYVNSLASTTKNYYQFAQDVLDLINQEVTLVPFKDNEFIHPNSSAKILNSQNEMIGWIGKIHPKYDDTDAFYAEFLDQKDNHASKFNSISYDPYKTLDLTFELNVQDNIATKVTEIKSIAKVFEIVQIDDFYKKETNTRFVTLRSLATAEEIEKIDKHFNK